MKELFESLLIALFIFAFCLLVFYALGFEIEDIQNVINRIAGQF